VLVAFDKFVFAGELVAVDVFDELTPRAEVEPVCPFAEETVLAAFEIE